MLTAEFVLLIEESQWAPPGEQTGESIRSQFCLTLKLPPNILAEPAPNEERKVSKKSLGSEMVTKESPLRMALKILLDPKWLPKSLR